MLSLTGILVLFPLEPHCMIDGGSACHCSDVAAAGMEQYVELSKGPCAHWRPNPAPTLVVTNPPWGARLTDQGENVSLTLGKTASLFT